MSEILERLDQAINEVKELGLNCETDLWEVREEMQHMQKVIDRTAVLRLDLEVANNKLTAEIEQLRKAATDYIEAQEGGFLAHPMVCSLAFKRSLQKKWQS